MSSHEPGTFFGVGVGPGDPDLITRKAVDVLSTVDWIFFPASSRSEGGFARRIVEPLGLPEAKFRKVTLFMSRDRAADQDAYRRTVDDIAIELRQGKSVAWITEGDPSFYSTFTYLHDEMRRRYPEIKVEIVPGVSSIHAAAARAGVPVCNLNERLAVVPAAYGLERLPELLDEFSTVYLMKVHTVFDRLLDKLASNPGSVHALYLEKVGTNEERIVTDLSSLRGHELPYFSLVILRKEKAPVSVTGNGKHS